MKRNITGGVAALAMLMTTPGLAQDAPVAPAPAGEASPVLVVDPANATPVLRTGADVPLRLLQELTTEGKRARVGDRFRLETAEPVLVNGVTVIRVGSPAVGEITEVRNKGMWGKSGHLTARLLHVTVNGRQIRLSGSFDDKGRAGGVGAVAVSALVFAPAGFFMTGTSARIPSGTIVRSFVDEDVPLALPTVPMRAVPLEVGAPAGPATALAIAPVAAVDSGTQARCWTERTC